MSERHIHTDPPAPADEPGRRTIRALTASSSSGTSADVHPVNAPKADCAHELGDLCHRDRERARLLAAHHLVGGVEQDVLVQLFERRTLTYNPANPEVHRRTTAEEQPRPWN